MSHTLAGVTTPDTLYVWNAVNATVATLAWSHDETWAGGGMTLHDSPHSLSQLDIDSPYAASTPETWGTGNGTTTPWATFTISAVVYRVFSIQYSGLICAFLPPVKQFGPDGDLLSMLKNTASQKIGSQMVAAADGTAFTSSVTVYVTGDAGTQAIGSVSSGACTHEGNGYHTYAPAQAETNYDLIGFTFIGTGAVPNTVQVATQTAALDAAAIRTAVGLASANLDTQLSTIDDFLDTEVAAIKAKTDNLPSDPADASDVAALIAAVSTKVDTIDDFLDSEIAAIKAKTDQFVFTVANQVDANALTGGGGGSGLDAAGVRAAIGLASANLDTQLDALPTNAELATSQAAADDATLAAIAALNNLSQANIRTAVGLGSANLDTQIATLATPTNITAATGITVSAIGSGVITAASIAADAITDAKVASDVTIASVTGAVGSVTGNVGGNVVGSVATLTTLPTAPTDWLSAAAVSAAAVTKVQTGLATPTNITALGAGAITATVIADGAIDRATFAVDTGLQTIRSNTAQAGAAGSLTLDASASAVTDFYKDCWLVITGGTGVGQARLITAYNGTSKIATVTPNFATTPSGTPTFAVLPAGQIGGITGDLTGNLTGTYTGTVTLHADYDAAKTAASQTSVNDLPTNAELAVALGTSDDATLSAIAALNNLSAANVATQLATYDAPTNAEMVAAFTQIKGATWSSTDTLEAIRDRGDAAWITATGFSTLTASGVRDAVGLATASLDTQLTAIDNFLDTEVSAIKAQTDLLPSDPADASVVAGLIAAVSTKVDTIDDFLDTEVAAIKAKTDLIPASPAAVGSAMTLTSAYDAAKTAATQASVDDLPTNAELATSQAAADDATLAAIAALNNLSAANVATQLATYDAPTYTEMVAAFTQIKGATWSTTDTLEAIRDRGDAAWTTATGFSTLSASGVRDAVGLASANLDTQLTALPTNAELATALGTADDATLAAIAALNNLSAANVRTAVGLASANLDTQLADLPTVSEFNARTMPTADYFDAAADTVAHVTLVDTTTLTNTVTTYTGNTPQTGNSYPIISHGTYGNAQLLRTSAYTAPDNTNIGVAATAAASAATYSNAIDTRLPVSPAAVGSAMTLTSGERTSIGTAVWATTTRTLTAFGTLAADVWAYATRLLSTSPPTTAEIATALFVDGGSNKLQVNVDNSVDSQAVLSPDDIEEIAAGINESTLTANQIAAALLGETTVNLVGPLMTGQSHKLVRGSAYLHSRGTAPFIRVPKANYNFSGATAEFRMKLSQQSAVTATGTIVSVDENYYEVYADLAGTKTDDMTPGTGCDQFWVTLASGDLVCLSQTYLEVIAGIGVA